MTSTAGRRVLVVDDAPTVRMYHGGLLRQRGFEVSEAANGLEALEMALTGDYDLFLVDVNMPQLDGLSLVERLRCEVGVSAPVVTISTEAAHGDRVASAAAGATHHLVKPVTPQVLGSLAEVLTAPLPPTWSAS